MIRIKRGGLGDLLCVGCLEAVRTDDISYALLTKHLMYAWRFWAWIMDQVPGRLLIFCCSWAGVSPV